ncbi:unnamed protein product [marine sediment metagenome]|uniref:Uncharacterized protein n=1 Tax=marine sediment metagenome TaxID=412755 RepID=X1AE95_9ZZZZ
MESNKVTEIKTSVIPPGFLSGWKENIDFQMALQLIPDTLGSTESAIGSRHSIPYIQRSLSQAAILYAGNTWVIETNPDEPPWKSVEVDPCSDLWSKQSRVTQFLHEGFLKSYNALDVATTTDIAVDDSTRANRSLHNLQAEEKLGLFTISRPPSVHATPVLLTSTLEKRKPYIPPHDLLEYEE